MKFSFEIARNTPVAESATPTPLPIAIPTQPTAVRGRIAEADFPNHFFNDPNFITQGGGGYGIYPVDYSRQNLQAENLSQSNGFYYRVLEIACDHICGQGMSIQVETEDEALEPVVESIDKICHETFYGDVNQVDMRYYQWVFECLMSGMLCLSANENPTDGSLEFGDIPARWIQDLGQNPFNASDILWIKTQCADWATKEKVIEKNNNYYTARGVERKFWGEPAVLPVIRYNREQWQRDKDGKILLENGLPLSNADFGRLTGEVFLLRLGSLRGQKFGKGLGFHIHDLCIELENLIYVFRKAYEVQLNVVMHMQVKGIQQTDADKRAQMILPNAPVPLVTDENVTLNMLSPKLNPADLTELVKTLARFIAGIMGLPEFSMGDGTETNVATAAQQAPIMYQKFHRLRSTIESFFAFMLRYAVSCANDHDMLYVENGTKRKLTPNELKKIVIRVVLDPFEQNNLDNKAKALKDITDALLAVFSVQVDGQQIFDVSSMMDAWTQTFASFGLKLNPRAIEANTTTGQSITGAGVSMQDVK